MSVGSRASQSAALSGLELVLLVGGVLAAEAAELLLLQLVAGLLALEGRVVAVAASGALEEHEAFLGLHRGSPRAACGAAGAPCAPAAPRRGTTSGSC